MFAPYELVWAGGGLGRALAQGLYWGRFPRERLAEGLSRYRERRRLAKEAAQSKEAEAPKAGGPLLRGQGKTDDRDKKATPPDKGEMEPVSPA
jgi:hypothetical protein